MGFPYGSDEDAAFVIAWLELNKFKGIVLLASLINELNNKYEGKIKLKNLNDKIDFQNKSILMKGSGLIDYLSSEIEIRKKITANIINCKNGIFFLPLLYKKSKIINCSQLIIYDQNNYINKYEIRNKKINYSRKKSKNLLMQNTVQILMNKNKNNKNSTAQTIISENKIQQNLAQSLSPEKNAWNQIEKIANKTFVPISNESREKGAGGGDDND
tara:strand:+ start:3621 stop:4265 length:645 start_codon:yes stop_codon:yes gene_type:complete